MFRSIFNILMQFYGSGYLMPFWISCGGVVVAGAAAVVIKGVCFRV